MASPSIRDDFRELLTGEDRHAIVDGLREASTASKGVRFYCEKCRAENRVEIADVRTRLEAAKFLTEQGLGKLLQEPPPRGRDDRPLEQLSDDELEAKIYALRVELGEDTSPDERELAYEAAKRVVATYEAEIH